MEHLWQLPPINVANVSLAYTAISLLCFEQLIGYDLVLNKSQMGRRRVYHC